MIVFNRLIFWSDGGGGKSHLYSAGLDGKKKRTISNNVISVNGLALDLEKKQLFFLEDKMGKFISLKYSYIQSDFLSPRAVDGYSLSYYDNHLYWFNNSVGLSLLKFGLESPKPSEVYSSEVSSSTTLVCYYMPLTFRSFSQIIALEVWKCIVNHSVPKIVSKDKLRKSLPVT